MFTNLGLKESTTIKTAAFSADTLNRYTRIYQNAHSGISSESPAARKISLGIAAGLGLLGTGMSYGGYKLKQSITKTLNPKKYDPNKTFMDHRLGEIKRITTKPNLLDAFDAFQTVSGVHKTIRKLNNLNTILKAHNL